MKNSPLAPLLENYENYRDKDINPEYISHDDLLKKILELNEKGFFLVNKLGKSLNNKDIYSLSIGNGKAKVFAWSQMHGDEPTATAALLDVFNFFMANDKYDSIKKVLLEKISFNFIPMINPDGAARFQRENAFNIDLNRDALRLQSDESAMLWNFAVKNKPDFAFNLHDQNSYYTVGRNGKTSAISLLAPPMDYSKSINYTREKSMQVILSMIDTLELFIPGHIARYSDDFEPRAFGDNFTKLGISTILIESGYYKGDKNKELIRKMNFAALISSFWSIANNDFEKKNYNDYFHIPENERLLFDLLIRNLTIVYLERKFTVDVGINRKKRYNSSTGTFYFEGTIADIGDLSIYQGIEEYNFEGSTICDCKILEIDSSADFEILNRSNEIIIVKNGFLNSNT